MSCREEVVSNPMAAVGSERTPNNRPSLTPTQSSRFHRWSHVPLRGL